MGVCLVGACRSIRRVKESWQVRDRILEPTTMVSDECLQRIGKMPLLPRIVLYSQPARCQVGEEGESYSMNFIT